MHGGRGNRAFDELLNNRLASTQGESVIFSLRLVAKGRHVGVIDTNRGAAACEMEAEVLKFPPGL